VRPQEARNTDTGTRAVEVRHNGEVKARYDSGDSIKDQNDAWMHILKHQPHSVDYARRYGGWTIVIISAAGAEHKGTP
jgi:hypothetical protein